jgi:hypothetical protein
MQTQGYPVQGVQNVPNVQNIQNVQNLQTAQMGYNTAPGLTQNAQNSFGTVQGQMYTAPGQAAYGAQSAAPGIYGPTAGQ